MSERHDDPIPATALAGVGGAFVAGREPRSLWREAVALLPDLGRLLRSLMADNRVPRRAKLVAGIAVGYVASPVDLVPGSLALGGIDDVVVVLLVVRYLVATAGYDLVRELWTGTDDGFGLLVVLAGVKA